MRSRRGPDIARARALALLVGGGLLSLALTASVGQTATASTQQAALAQLGRDSSSALVAGTDPGARVPYFVTGRIPITAPPPPPSAAFLSIGAPYESLGGAVAPGAANVLYGSPLSATGNQFWTQNSPGVLDVSEAGDHFASAQAIGDFNNDGVSDLAVGVFNEDVGSIQGAGAVNVLYGSASGSLGSGGNQFWTQDSPGVLDAAEAFESFGQAVAVGDFDGDGYDDLAVGSSEGLGTVGNAGAVNVLYGSATGLNSGGNQWWTQGSAGVLDASESEDRFGRSLAAGDFNADGEADLAVGSAEDLGSSPNHGAVNVLYGSNPNGLSAAGNQFWSQNSAGVLDLAEPDDHFGTSLAAGDFDGDGAADLAAGVPGEGLGSVTRAGAVNILYGSASSGLSAAGNQWWTQNSPGILDPGEIGDQFGSAVTGGDFDNDGRDDLAVGVYTEGAGPVDGGGAVSVLYGSAPTGLAASGNQYWSQNSPGVLDTTEAFDGFGFSLAAADLDSDGTADLAIGAPHEDLGPVAQAGSVNVLYGGAVGLSPTGNQWWTQNSAGILDVAEGDEKFGWSLAAG